MKCIYEYVPITLSLLPLFPFNPFCIMFHGRVLLVVIACAIHLDFKYIFIYMYKYMYMYKKTYNKQFAMMINGNKSISILCSMYVQIWILCDWWMKSCIDSRTFLHKRRVSKLSPIYTNVRLFYKELYVYNQIVSYLLIVKT